MKKERLQLKDISVTSFVTALDKLRGGRMEKCPNDTVLDCENPATPPMACNVEIEDHISQPLPICGPLDPLEM